MFRIIIIIYRSISTKACYYKKHIVACHMHWNDGTNDTHSYLRAASSEELERGIKIFKKEETHNISIIIECYELDENK